MKVKPMAKAKRDPARQTMPRGQKRSKAKSEVEQLGPVALTPFDPDRSETHPELVKSRELPLLCDCIIGDDPHFDKVGGKRRQIKSVDQRPNRQRSEKCGERAVVLIEPLEENGKQAVPIIVCAYHYNRLRNSGPKLPTLGELRQLNRRVMINTTTGEEIEGGE